MKHGFAVVKDVGLLGKLHLTEWDGRLDWTNHPGWTWLYERKQADEYAGLFGAEAVPANRFTCDDCHQIITHIGHGGTGYGTFGDKTVCYGCCGERDRREFLESDRWTFYLSRVGQDWYVGNWPGTFKIGVNNFRRGRHNIAGTRCDVWFYDERGRCWWGVNYGNFTQIVHCKRLKAA